MINDIYFYLIQQDSIDTTDESSSTMDGAFSSVELVNIPSETK